MMSVHYPILTVNGDATAAHQHAPLAPEGVPAASFVQGDALEIVELAALCHDVGDWKYSGSDTAGPAKVKVNGLGMDSEPQAFPGEIACVITQTLLKAQALRK